MFILAIYVILGILIFHENLPFGGGGGVQVGTEDPPSITDNIMNGCDIASPFV